MLLAIDIGNTNICAGVWENNHLLLTFRTDTEKNRSADEYYSAFSEHLKSNGLEFSNIDSSIVSCVVRELAEPFRLLIEHHLQTKPVFVSSEMNTGLEISYEEPGELGPDRIANSAAAFKEHCTSVIVVDFGTATTFDCISAAGEYLGGIICPGLKTSSDAMIDNTSLLPKAELKKPRDLIGKSTAECIQSGLINGHVALVEGLIDKIRSRMNEDSKVVATGGFSDLIAEESTMIDYVDKNLTLKGLKYLYEING